MTQKRIFWLFVILFIIGMGFHHIATTHYQNKIIAKEYNDLDFDIVRICEGELKIETTFPREKFNLEELGENCNNPNEVLLEFEINKANQTDVFKVSRKMFFAHSSNGVSFDSEIESPIKLSSGNNKIELKLKTISDKIKNEEIEFIIHSEVPGMLLIPNGLVHKIIWFFNFWILWGIILIVWAIVLFKKKQNLQ